jgi:hypothetical protein
VGTLPVVDPERRLRGAPQRVWASWHRHKLPDDEFRTLLRAVRDDAGEPCQRPVTDDYFLAHGRRERLEQLEEWSRRLNDRRLRRLVEDVVRSGTECWARTKPPVITEQDPRWTAWQSAAARSWLSASKAALERLDVLERRQRSTETAASVR